MDLIKYKPSLTNLQILYINLVEGMSNIGQFSENSSNIYTNHLQKMYIQVKMTLGHLLSYLTYMYSAHGIIYDVTNLHETILRMLTPLQVLAYFNCYNPAQLVQQSKFYQKSRQNNQRKQAQQNVSSKTKNHSQNGYFSNSKQIFKPMMKQKAKIGLKQDHGLRNNDRHTRRKSTYRVYNGGKPILSAQQQNQVKIFMENEVRKGKILTMNKIASEAKKIAKNSQYFLASHGWVKNFLKRHQDMRQLYNKSRNIKPQTYQQNIQTKPKNSDQYQFNDQQDNQKDYSNSQNQNNQYLSKQPYIKNKNKISMLSDMLGISSEQIRQQYLQFQNQDRIENQYSSQEQKVSFSNQDQDQYYNENSLNSINQQENI